MEVFGLKSQSLRYKMDGFGSVQMYLTPPDYFGLAPPPHAPRHHHHHHHQHLMQQAATATATATAAAATTMSGSTGASVPQPRTTLVVGASRGIGRELAQQLARQQQPSGGEVIVSVRSAADWDGQQQQHPNVRSLTLDQSSAKSVGEAALAVAALDTLIVNAAIGDDERLLATSDARMAEYMDVNVTGVLRVVKAFLPALRARRTRQIVLVSSTSGSITRQVDAKTGFRGPYAVSTAALNMVAVQLHNELHASDGFTVVPIHPGWVATDMGRISGDGGMPVSKSAAGILKVVNNLTPQNSATFYNYDGTTLPW
ncbi:hypothetical protein V2A60_006336 [Cordyceps javanica]|uniref:Short-chain dehydrogenase/reductase SDR n=1 Tax=Cordyceps javanica TaxID=43265 RepID=A0A545V8A5_9HYPO|nr:short-chain dehydrogenase/reductase SDR [Cordyceps javanica]TQW08865.1 short-chain dehydrogenase/reductase SDR [Cordyceps javanica]